MDTQIENPGMKCQAENCGDMVHVIHVNTNHERVCDNCYYTPDKEVLNHEDEAVVRYT